MDARTQELLRRKLADGHKVFVLEVRLRRDTAHPSVVMLDLLGDLCRSETVFASEPDMFKGPLDAECREYRFFLETPRGQLDFRAFVETVMHTRIELESQTISLLTIEDLDRELPQHPQTMGSRKTIGRTGSHGKSIRVDQNALYEMGTLIHMFAALQYELRSVHERLENGALLDPERIACFEELRGLDNKYGRVVKKIGDTLNMLKLESLAKLFASSAQLAKELSLELGRKVNIQLLGSELKVDKVILEYLREVFMHLLRNSLDHGIESPEERRAVGKDETGVIRLAAHEEGDEVVLELSDDGRGIDLDKVRATALRNGLIKAERLAGMAEDDLLALVFEPNFSTRETASALSGRGVGMDVVRTNLAIVGGTIAITTRPGRGTLFTIRLPRHVTEEIIRAEGDREETSEEDYLLCMAEIDEHLQEMDLGLETLRSANQGKRDIYYDVFRRAHTIKGLAAFCHEDGIVRICHGLEEVLQHVLDGKLCDAAELDEIISSVIDTVNGMVAGASLGAGFEVDTSAVLEKLETLLRQCQLH
ncbi:MAG: hypothetical protein A2284_03745 [Deltaproteobacteria bacterium RIFOXYA12_FULL_61_11]|nr:MAG: hypothetical protein A2284_03745 [Deltaproteobacteria bacterium RIFOXYA12_FULL_61_11]